MANLINQALQFQEQIFDGNGNFDIENYYSARNGSPDVLMEKLVYLLGVSQVISVPLTTMLLGQSDFSAKSTKAKVLKDLQYTYPVIGQTDKCGFIALDCTTSGVNSNQPTGKVGLNGSEFKLVMTDNWIKRHYVIDCNGTQAYVLQDPVQKGGNWEYTVVLTTNDPDSYVPAEYLQSGMAWIEMFTANPESGSRGTESKTVAPGAAKNQMTILRDSIQWNGALANKIMRFSIVAPNGKSVDSYLDYAIYQMERRWANQTENALWYSTYNRSETGEIKLRDVFTNKVIPTGSGLLEQIPNKATYSRLTYDKLESFIASTYYNMSDSQNLEITLFTGRGGMREINRAIAGKFAFTAINPGNVADKFVKGQDRALSATGFFTQFAHIDGYTIKLVYCPWFDMGARAKQQLASRLIHPETGFPLESYRMVFLDNDSVNGQPNIQAVTLEGMDFKHGIVKGLANIPNSWKAMAGLSNDTEFGVISSDQDVASYHRMRTIGVQILRASRCLDIECIASAAA